MNPASQVNNNPAAIRTAERGDLEASSLPIRGYFQLQCEWAEWRSHSIQSCSHSRTQPLWGETLKQMEFLPAVEGQEMAR